jgi:outer membrane murein-binding lipoprotein Lpp
MQKQTMRSASFLLLAAPLLLAACSNEKPQADTAAMSEAQQARAEADKATQTAQQALQTAQQAQQQAQAANQRADEMYNRSMHK